MLIAAEFLDMLYVEDDDDVCSLQDLDGNIDLFASGMYEMFSDDGEKNIEQGTLQLSSTFNQMFSKKNKKQIENDGDTIICIIERIRTIVQNYDGTNDFSSEFRNCFNDLLRIYNKYFPKDELKDDALSEVQYNALILFVYRFLTSLSVETLVDIFFAKQGSTEIIEKLLLDYLQKGDEKNG